MNIDKKYYQEINENLTNTIQDTNISAPNKKVGKVRDEFWPFLTSMAKLAKLGMKFDGI